MGAKKGGNKGSFKPGNKEGAKGKRPPGLPPELKDKSRETKEQIINAYVKFAGMTRAEIEKAKPDTVIEGIIFKVLSKAAKSGDINQLSRIWAECHGTPKQSVDLKHELTLTDYISQLSDAELDAAIDEFQDE